MSAELVKALLAVYAFCIGQHNCRNCPLNEFCGKMPSEWID